MAQHGLKNTTLSPILIGSQSIPASSTLVFYDSSTHFSDFQDDVNTALNSSGTLNSMLANDTIQYVVDGVAKTDQQFYDFWGQYFGYTVISSTPPPSTTDGFMSLPQATSMFWASPAGAAKGSPSFRRVEASDLPDLGASYARVSGQTFTGKVVTVASSSSRSGFSVLPGVAPASPLDGDVWTTNSGIFAQVNGSTYQLNSTQTFLPTAGGTMTGKIFLVASAGGSASLNIPVGTAPSAPTAGDLYSLSGHILKYSTGSLEKTIAFVESANSWASKQSFAASTSTASSINIAPGTSPSSPSSGDVWNNNGALTWYNGTTALVVAALNAPNTWASSQTFNYITTFNASLVVQSAKVSLASSAASYASLNIPVGTAPSTSMSGDLWNVGGQLKFHNGSVAASLAQLEKANTWTGIQTMNAGASVFNGKLTAASATDTYASLNIPTAAANPLSPVTGDMWVSTDLMWCNGTVSTPVAVTGISQTWTSAPVFGAGFSVSNNEALFAPATATYASLNIPTTTVSPSTPSTGDVWNLNGSLVLYDGSAKTIASLEKNQIFSGSIAFSSLLNANAGLTVSSAKTTLAVSSASYASLNIPSSSVAVTLPVAGDMSMYRSSLRIHDGQAEREVVKDLWCQTSTVTLNNSTTQTSLRGTISPSTLSNTLPANYFSYIGKRLTISARGTVYDSGATTMSLVTMLGSTVLFTASTPTIPKLNSNPETWWLEIDVVCRSTGSAGTLQVNGICIVSNNTTGLSPWHLKMPSSLVSFNTTVAAAADLQAKWGAANANNTISMTQFMGRG